MEHNLPHIPFKVLDAPGLRDDFYCSVLAFSPICNTLAVGLGDTVYRWSEYAGACSVERINTAYVSSLSFSSTDGGKALLAVGRAGGWLSLRCLSEPMARFQTKHRHSVTSVS